MRIEGDEVITRLPVTEVVSGANWHDTFSQLKSFLCSAASCTRHWQPGVRKYSIAKIFCACMCWVEDNVNPQCEPQAPSPSTTAWSTPVIKNVSYHLADKIITGLVETALLLSTFSSLFLSHTPVSLKCNRPAKFFTLFTTKRTMKHTVIFGWRCPTPPLSSLGAQPPDATVKILVSARLYRL